MFARVREFGITNATLFPAESLGGKLFASLGEVISKSKRVLLNTTSKRVLLNIRSKPKEGGSRRTSRAAFSR